MRKIKIVPDHKHGEHPDHDHHHNGGSGKNTELIFSLTCGVLTGVGWVLSFVTWVPVAAPKILYMAAYFFGGYFTTKEAVLTVGKGALK